MTRNALYAEREKEKKQMSHEKHWGIQCNFEGNPIYRTHAFITVEGNGRGKTNAYIKGQGIDVGADLFRRGLCLPSDNKMTPAQQDRIIEIIHRCFR